METSSGAGQPGLAGRTKDEGGSMGKLVLLGENHLRTAVREYVAHYHTERNHQGLEGRLIEPPANVAVAGPIVGRERVGGLLRFYHRQAVSPSGRGA